MKTYVLTLSRTFPAKHPRKGEPTNFDYQVLNAVWRSHNMSIGLPQYGIKLHTIRANYELWSKRFEQIDEGKAALSIRYWTGKPYHSKQTEICKLTREDGICIQKMEFLAFQEGYRKDAGIWIAGNVFPIDEREQIALNDGLTLQDWDDWFKSCDLSKPLAIIHFTKFRY